MLHIKPKPLLWLSNLTVRYAASGSPGVVALRDVSLVLNPGDMCVVVGPNGSGKSTLLHTITGSSTGTASGIAKLDDSPLFDQPMHRRARSLAIVHQDPMRGTAARLNLEEHCALTVPYRHRKAVTWAAVDQRLRALGTRLDPDRPAQDLSGGQRQLFTIILAVLAEPRLLLLDEPTASLDTRHQGFVRHVLQDFAERADSASILVTHDLENALKFGTQMLVLDARGATHLYLEPDEKSTLTDSSLRDHLAAAASVPWARDQEPLVDTPSSVLTSI